MWEKAVDTAKSAVSSSTTKYPTDDASPTVVEPLDGRGRRQPRAAVSPTPLPAAPGQESVWDYPRPPRVENTSELVVVTLDGLPVATTTGAVRVLETSHPPVYYLPFDAFEPGVLEAAVGSSVCEFKGVASYVSVRVGGRLLSRVGWTYPAPLPGYEVLVDRVALYAGGPALHGRRRAWSSRRPAGSTAAGSRRASSARSRDRRAPAAGER